MAFRDETGQVSIRISDIRVPLARTRTYTRALNDYTVSNPDSYERIFRIYVQRAAIMLFANSIPDVHVPAVLNRILFADPLVKHTVWPQWKIVMLRDTRVLAFHR